MENIPWTVAGVASGVNNTGRQVGAALGIALVGSTFATFGSGPAVLAAAAAVFAGVLSSALIPGRRPAVASPSESAPQREAA